MNRTKYFLAAAMVVFAVLFKYGAPLGPVLAGLAGAAVLFFRPRNQARAGHAGLSREGRATAR